MIEQKINKRIAQSIMALALLHIIALSFYLFNAIPEKYWSLFFWYKSDIYILVLTALMAYIVANKIVKIALKTSFYVYLAYFLLVNVRIFGDNQLNWTEMTWGYICATLILILLIISIYVSRIRQF